MSIHSYLVAELIQSIYPLEEIKAFSQLASTEKKSVNLIMYNYAQTFNIVFLLFLFTITLCFAQNGNYPVDVHSYEGGSLPQSQVFEICKIYNARIYNTDLK